MADPTRKRLKDRGASAVAHSNIVPFKAPLALRFWVTPAIYRSHPLPGAAGNFAIWAVDIENDRLGLGIRLGRVDVFDQNFVRGGPRELAPEGELTHQAAVSRPIRSSRVGRWH
ncbi:hypothetical protein J2Z31_001778 [Sinorhizobium kostiense]|uniref:Uncharacterized protein n=1 Tax=Sinorhizobium kostiense TaxID=76747 RepID=A0ABS4QYQ6_9HYPH|nr:hypothetical protein [Sinorhizobium kostiense]